MEAGGRSTAAYFEQIGSQKLADPASLAPYLNRLREVEVAQNQAAESARAQADAERELAQAQATKEAFVASLREQIALYGKSTDEVLRYRAAQAGAAQEASHLILQLQNMRAAHEQIADAARAEAQAQREAAQAQAGRDNFISNLTNQVNSIGKTRSQLLEMQAAQLGISEQAGPLIQRLRETESAFNDTGMSAGETANALRQVPAQVTDMITSLQGGMDPLTVLIQQGGQLRDTFGGIRPAAQALGNELMKLINPYTLAAAAAVALTAAYYQGSREADAYNRAIILSGNVAGTSRNQLADLAREISKTTGTQAKASEAVAALAGSGQVGAKNLRDFGLLAVQMEKDVGQSIETTVSDLAELGNSPVEASRRLNDAYRYLTGTTLEQIKALEEQGRAEEAGEMAQKAYVAAFTERTGKMRENLGLVERAWRGATGAAKSAWDEFLGVGRTQTPKERLEEVRAALADADKAPSPMALGDRSGFSGATQRALNQADKKALQREEIELVYKINKEEWDSQQEAVRQQMQKTLQTWNDGADQYLSKAAKLENTVTRITREGLAAGVAQKEIDERIAAARAAANNESIEASIAGLHKLDGVADLMLQRELGRIATRKALGEIGEDEALRAAAERELGLLDEKEKKAQRQLALARKLRDGQTEVAQVERDLAEIQAEKVSRAAQLENDLATAQFRRFQDNEDNHRKGIQSAEAELKSLKDQVDAQVLANAEIGLGKIEVADLAAKRLLAAAAQKEQTAASIAAVKPEHELVEVYRQQAAELRKLATGKQVGATKAEADDTSKKALEELNKFLDPSKAQTFGEALREAFGAGGDALSKLMANMDSYSKRQAEITEARKNAEKARGQKDFNEVAYLKTITELGEREIKNRVQGYGDMASAAKGFFSDGSKGYKLLEGAERAFRAMELASQMESLYTHLFVTGAKATGTAAGQAVETGAVVAGEAARNVAKVPGVFMSFMSAMGPWGAAAAAVAVAAVLGGAFSGGGGVSVSESRQKSQGTGTVLGSDAKSESIAKSLEMIENATFQGLSVSTDMLSQLRSIDSNLTNFSTLVVQTTGIKGSLADGLESGSGGFWGKLGNSIFGGKTSVEDTGFSMNPIAFADVFRGWVDSYEYADTKKSGGWFSSDKYRTQIEGLGEEGNRQIALVLTSLYGAVESAGGMLGLAGKDFTDKLNGFVVDIGMVSLKGLSGEEIEKEIQAVFSKVGDQLALYSLDGLKDFQKSGEGYLETLTRIATGYQTVTVVADSMGMSFNAIGVGSIAARQRLIDLAGGLDAFKESADSFMSDFYTDKERADALRARIQPTLDKFGIQTGADDSMDQFRDVVKSLRLETAAGAQDFATLMQIMPAFKQIADIDAALFEDQVELARSRRDLEIQIMELTGDKVSALAATRALELAETDGSLHALLERVYGLQDEAAALELAGSKRQLEAQILGLLGDKAGQLAITRELELAGMDPALRALRQRYFALQDEAAAAEAANSLLTLQAQIYELTGDKAGAAAVLAQQHANALKELDPALRTATEQLWGLQAAAKGVEQVKAIAAALVTGVESAFTALQSVVGREKALLQDVANKHKALADALRGTLDSMSVSGQERQDRSAAQAQIAAALAIAKASGTLPDVDSLKGALSIVGKDSASLFSTQEEYLRDFYATQGDIADLAGLTDKTLSVEEQSIKRLDDILANAQQQVNALKGLDTTMLTLVDVMRDFDRVLGSAQADPVASAGGTLTKLYRELLGRAPDAGGLEFYKARLAEGVTLEQIRNDILQSLEYKQLKGIPGFAGGGFFGGGYRVVGENGPELETTGPARIFNASETSGMLARMARPSEDYAALLAEVRVLRTAFGGLFPVLYQVAKNTGRGANSLEKMDRREEVNA